MQPLPANSKSILLTVFLLVFFSIITSAQIVPGYINRQATSVAGRAVLDPNNDGYTSTTTSGFGTPSDVATSEIGYKIVQSYSIEPFGDLRRGPDQAYSDFVPDGANDGFYTYFDGTNLMFRFRLGSIMPGSKGYSVLMDTDGKFGSSGTSADPNYVAATTGTNGNPGFEIEIVLETNFRIAVYNVDGNSSPALVTSYTNWQDMSQVSIAATNDGGDPDFFMDFYIPFSALSAAPFNLTASSPIRMIPTTVMSPQAAIGGPKSDIYGLNDDAYNNTNTQYQTFITAQPLVTFTNLGSGGSGFGGMCSEAPALNSPIGVGTVNVSGTWTASTLSGAVTTATITVYKNGTSIGTVSGVTSGSTWTLNSVTAAANDVFTARAQATGESMCLTSNSVTALSCAPANRTATSNAAFGACVNNRRGIAGTKTANAIIKIYSHTTAGAVLYATDGSPASPSTFNITYGSPSNVSNTTWEYNGANNSGSSDPCSGGPNDIPNGSYYITVTLPSQCESAPIWGSCVNLTATATPVITQTTLYAGTSTVSGTAAAGATVFLYRNGNFISSTVATGGVYSFTNVSLALNDLVEVFAQASGNCVSAIVSRTVTCYTGSPLITSDNNSQVAAGSPITGTSSEPVGTTIRIYNVTGPTLVATTTVQVGGTWSTAGVPYNAVAGTTYYATAQNGSCAVSVNSGNVSAAANTSSARCGTITGPVSSGAASVSGTLATAVAGTTVNLYLDEQLIGSTTTSTTSWTVSSIPSTTIYSNGVLTIGVRESGSREVACTASVTISCSPSPTAPTFTPANTTIGPNQSVTYTVTNAETGTFYSVASSTTNQSLGTGKWATSNGNLTLTTDIFSSLGTYSIVIKATSISGVTVCTTVSAPASIDVASTLPLTLVALRGRWVGRDIALSWETKDEYNTESFEIEKSTDARTFTAIGKVQAAGSSSTSSSYHFTDTKVADGVNFYKLKMKDLDGTFTYSNIIAVRSGAVREIKLWPNPFTNEFNIVYVAEGNSAIQIRITDMSGRLLLSEKRIVSRGNNQLQVSNLNRFSSGTYFIEVTDVQTKLHSNFKMLKQ
jgi:Secretion system C-terminal sorting domain